MIVEYIRYRVEDGEALVEAYEAASKSLRASSFCHGFELARCLEEPAVFILRILWDSADGHLQGFRKSPEFREFFAAIKPFVSTIEEMRHYEATTVAWQRGRSD